MNDYIRYDDANEKSNNFINEKENYFRNYNNYDDKKEVNEKYKLKDIEKTINKMVNKSINEKLGNEEISIRERKSNEKYLNDSRIMNFELEHLKQENITLKNDNIILREDLNRLNEIGVSLENELDYTRKKK